MKVILSPRLLMIPNKNLYKNVSIILYNKLFLQQMHRNLQTLELDYNFLITLLKKLAVKLTRVCVCN